MPNMPSSGYCDADAARYAGIAYKQQCANELAALSKRAA
jgi:hypothetical protein